MKAQELCDAIGRVDEFLGTVPLEDAKPIAVTDWGLVHAAASSWAALEPFLREYGFTVGAALAFAPDVENTRAAKAAWDALLASLPEATDEG